MSLRYLVLAILPLTAVLGSCLWSTHLFDSSFLLTIAISLAAYFVTLWAIPRCSQSHLRAHLGGIDLNKLHDPKTEPPRVPESLGLESCGIFIVAVVILSSLPDLRDELLPATLTIVITTLLGFADDVLDIPWRIKYLIPFVTGLPLILHYSGSTTICLHGFLSPLRRFFEFDCLDIGFFYFVYIVMLNVFCTHCINIYAGINGLEAGQSFVVASFLLFHSLSYWSTEPGSRGAAALLLPFICTTFALLHFNWFPSRAFVGDTFTLTAGCVIAAAGILGHFAEMTLLFMAPEVLNFVISLPQLVGIVPCPRHRLPVLNRGTGKLEGKRENLNLVNWWLIVLGPRTEGRLCAELLLFQVACCIGAYVVKYFYNQAIVP
jgi:UDP-N-acetylglucosamine--dolichyl-phosphate N-acetylglucosaminephosphotransferase